MSTDIKKILDDEIAHAIGVEGSEASKERAEALKYYRAEPRGDEIEGRSQVISTDVADAIEWIMPQVIDTFFSNEEIMSFDPVSAEDEAQAEIESDYVSHVALKENEAFLTFNTWFRDALLLKNGYVKVFWESPKEHREEYFDLDPQQFMLIQGDYHFRVEEVSQKQAEDGTPLIDCVVYRSTANGQVRYEAVPPEHVLINSDHNSVTLEDARFVAHEELRTASSLIEDGYDKAVVETIPPHDYDGDETTYSREMYQDEMGDDAGDYSMRLIRVYECYVMVDPEGDGIAKRHRIIYAGGEILEDEEHEFMPFVSLTSIIFGHQHLGLSLYDRLKMIQDQKTSIWRNLLDNMYLTNNVRLQVRTGLVNMNDLLTNRPNGLVRIKKDAPSDTVTQLQVQPMGMHSFQMLEYLDKTREERSGVGPDTMGQSEMLSNDTAHGIERIMSAKEMLVGLMTRTLAEVGVKPLFLKIRELLMRHQDKPKLVKLKGQWTPVNPVEWRDRMNTTLKVGLGTGDKLKQLSAMQEILGIQEKLAMNGMDGVLVTPKHIFNALEDLAKFGGLPSAEPYFLDPESDEAKMIQQQKAQQPPPPDPNMMLIEVEKEKNQIKAQELQLEQQTGMQKAQMEHQYKAAESDRMLAIKERELDLKEREMYFKYQQPAEMQTQQIEGNNQLAEILANLAQTLNSPRTIQRDEMGEIIGIG